MDSQSIIVSMTRMVASCSRAVVLAIAMGLRWGEIVGLRWPDLDLDNRVLHVGQQARRRRGVLCDDDPDSRRRPFPAARPPLRWHRMRQTVAGTKAGERWRESNNVFVTRTGLRVIRLHDARHCHPPRGDRSRALRRDGDLRALPDRHYRGRLHARRPGHSAGGREPHGPAVQEASPSVTASDVYWEAPSPLGWGLRLVPVEVQTRGRAEGNNCGR